MFKKCNILNSEQYIKVGSKKIKKKGEKTMSFFRKMYEKAKHAKNLIYCSYKGKPCIHYET